ncbi:hypothetical protein PCL_11834 [Purpureocillium lilacinum]|uniref:N-acetylglutamate synthase n=1 Tax=Purpureocillium lilacinum TaxID=33203 RepID=A0A2U3EB96_PURLI|nr:hypothetical protein PCL_11834 [Purpureocillium lilacinum]
MSISYDGKTFRSTSNTANGEVGAETTFHYHQDGSIVWAEYAGGSVVRGSLVAVVVATQGDSLDMRYNHVNREGQLMTGRCVSRPEVLPDGRLRMHETWRWTSGDESSGESVVEEVREEFSGAPIEKQTKKQRNRTIRIPPVLRGHRTETVAPAAAAATEDGRRASPTWNHPSSSSAAAGQASKQRPLHRPGRRLDAGSPRDPLAGPAANCDPRKRCVGK